MKTYGANMKTYNAEMKKACNLCEDLLQASKGWKP